MESLYVLLMISNQKPNMISITLLDSYSRSCNFPPMKLQTIDIKAILSRIISFLICFWTPVSSKERSSLDIEHYSYRRI